jgi:hypothetical protein
MRTVTFKTAIGSTVPMECDVLDARPKPEIQWFANNDQNPIVQDLARNSSFRLEKNGRILFVRRLTDMDRMSTYYCKIVNTIPSPVRAPTTYALNGSIDGLEVILYRPTEVIYIRPEMTIRHVVGVGGPQGRLILFSCESQQVLQGIIGSDMLEVTINRTGSITAQCTVQIGNVEHKPSILEVTYVVLRKSCTLAYEATGVTYTMFLSEPVVIQSPDNLNDRERFVGGGSVTYICNAQGAPPPTVTWFYNGAAIYNVIGNVLMIPDPQVNHSGIYQCIGSNVVDGEPQDASIEWILEVRDPSEFLLNIQLGRVAQK